MGDGLLIYFGWPRAHEDDAGRAINAGLGILDAQQSLTAVKGTTILRCFALLSKNITSKIDLQLHPREDLSCQSVSLLP